MNRLCRQIERMAEELAGFGVTPEKTFSAAAELLGWKAADVAADRRQPA